VITSYRHVAVQEDLHIVSYFTRLMSQPPGYSITKTSRIELRMEHASLVKGHMEKFQNTVFDYVYDQYLRHKTDFNFGDATDCVYRYTEGALSVWQFGHHNSVIRVRLDTDMNVDKFPETDGQITDLTFMIQEKQGNILPEYGTPVLVKLEKNGYLPSDPEYDPRSFRLPAGIETEDDDFIVAIYHPKGDDDQATISRKRLVMKTLLTVPIYEPTFEPILTTDSSKVPAAALLLDVDKVATFFDAGQHPDDFRAYWLGKMLIPGEGVKSYMLEASGGPGAELIHRKIFVATKNSRAMVMCLGIPALDEGTKNRIFTDSFSSMKIYGYNLFEFVLVPSPTGNPKINVFNFNEKFLSRPNNQKLGSFSMIFRIFPNRFQY